MKMSPVSNEVCIGVSQVAQGFQELLCLGHIVHPFLEVVGHLQRIQDAHCHIIWMHRATSVGDQLQGTEHNIGLKCTSM